MRTAKELCELANIQDDSLRALEDLKRMLNECSEIAFNKMIENPRFRKQYLQKPLMVIGCGYDKEVIQEFSKYAASFGYYVYDDPFSFSFPVYFSKNICGNPYRKLIKTT